MSEIKVKVTIKDTLAFYNNYVEDYTFNPDNSLVGEYFYDVPAEWWTGSNLTEYAVEEILKRIYGDNWRSGNGDGSKYQVLDFTASLADSGAQEK